MSKQRKIKPLLVVVVLLQALFLLTMAGSYHLAHAWGEEIRLKTMPVDPRDLFYGDYVTLGYEISTIPIELIDDLDASGNFHISDLGGKRIYVLLTEEYGLYRVERAYLDRRNVPKDSWPVLRGQIRAGWNDETRIDYGLERYYVPEGTGSELERRRDHIVMRIKIAPWGQALIVGPEL